MAAVLKAYGGDQVTIGDTHLGSNWPTRSSWGDRFPVADAGIPLHQYDPTAADPLDIWKTQPNVRKVVGYLARQFAMPPWKAYKRVSDDDRRRMQNSKAERLLSSPARFRSGFNLRETLLIDKLVYDRWCLLYLPPNKAGENERLLRVPPRRLEIKSNWMGEGKKIILLNPIAGEDDIDITDAPLAISWGWSADVAGGVSPMQTLRDQLIESRRAVQWRSHQWEQSPKVTGLLRHPSHYKDGTQRERFLQSWREWRDIPRAAGTPLLEDGMEYQELKGITPRDALDIEGRRFSAEEVATSFFLPPELLGLRESTFSNLVALRQMLFQTVLGPFYSEFESAVNAEIVQAMDAEPKLYIEADRDAAVAGSLIEQAQIFQTLTGAPVMTVAEARQRMNLPKLPNTDKLVVPMNVTEGGQASPRDTGSQNRKPNTEPEQETP